MIAGGFDAHAASDWQWCEDALTYDNARLCEALLRGGAALGNERYVQTGLAMLEFYAAVVIDRPRRCSSRSATPAGIRAAARRSTCGQQPLEAAALVDAAFAALDITGDSAGASVAEIAHEWYFGRNTLGVTLARARRRLLRRPRRGGGELQHGRRIDGLLSHERGRDGDAAMSTTTLRVAQ